MLSVVMCVCPEGLGLLIALRRERNKYNGSGNSGAVMNNGTSTGSSVQWMAETWMRATGGGRIQMDDRSGTGSMGGRTDENRDWDWMLGREEGC